MAGCPRVPSKYFSTGCLNAFVNLRVSDVVTVLRTLVCGERKFSSHDWVNELDITGDLVAEIAEIESHAPDSEPWRSLSVALLVDAADKKQSFVARIASYKNLGDADKQTQDDETSIDFKECTCVENLWAPMGRQRRFFYVGVQANAETYARYTHIWIKELWLHPDAPTRGPKSRFRVECSRNMLFRLHCVCDDASVSFPILTFCCRHHVFS